MHNPRVSFIVPCYGLGHLLPECLHSILSQSFEDFEILIMNDRSPDDTEQVAESFASPRVHHIHNDQNLGHLRNYNKGISLSRGEFVWIISADDYLRTTNVLSRYVGLMDAHPNIGYTVCPGYSVVDGQEREIVGTYGRKDAVVEGTHFLRKLLDSNFVLAASVMVRRKCYEDLGAFPLTASWRGQPVDMGWLGDWYLWCIFAMCFDVGYLAEPMVCYRTHDMSMTNTITKRESIASCAVSDVGMLWMIRERAEQAQMQKLSRYCLVALANEYAKQGASKHYRSASFRMSKNEVESSIILSTTRQNEQNFLRSRYLEGSADLLLRLGKRSSSKRYYLASLGKRKMQVKVLVKLVLLVLGRFGSHIRELPRRIRKTLKCRIECKVAGTSMHDAGVRA